MEDSYIRSMVRNENLCREYMQKAEDLYIQNGNKHSKEECLLLQKAAMCRSEMAGMSTGEERRFQQRRLQELNQKIESIVRQLNPEAFKNAAGGGKSSSGSAGSSGGSAGSGAGAGGASSSAGSSVADETVSGWFKEAPKHSFQDVSGMKELKKQLLASMEDKKLADLKSYLGMKNLQSYFFIGPPGCGKTYIIEAFAHELMDNDYKYLSLVGSDILSKYVGEAEKIITRLFEEAEKNAPCIVFIDEIDGVCKNRSLPNLPEYASSITTAFLTGYNRINSSDKQIIFIGATNYPNQVDNAMLDRVELVRVPLPDPEARQFSFEHKFGKILKLASDLSYSYMAGETDTYNYRDIDRLCARIKQNLISDVMKQYPDQKSALEALKCGAFPLTKEAFDKARSECLPTPKDDILRTLDEWEKKFNNGGDEATGKAASDSWEDDRW